jgi:hypothetical protein
MSEIAQLRALAGKGDPRSQLRLAHLMLTGRARESLPGEALSWVEQACALKHGDALLYMAALAARGHGRRQDLDAAVRLVGDAAAMGDTRAKGQLRALGEPFDQSAWLAAGESVQHHAAPRVFTIRNFLTKAACDWLIKASRKNLARAPVQTASGGGAFEVDGARSNSVAGTSALQPDLVIQMANLKIAATLGLPLAHQEPTNILHYARGERYAPHFDFISEHEEAGFARELRTIGQRVATFLVYLNDGYEGGETDFPRLGWRFRGDVGDALVFWNLSASGERELMSLHEGMAVTKGEKWLLSKWVRQRAVPLI